MRKSIKKVLVERDGITEKDAEERIEEARSEAFELIQEGRLGEAYEICQVHFGLEPDYLDELIM